MPQQLRPFAAALKAAKSLSPEARLNLIDAIQQLDGAGPEVELEPEKKTRKPRGSGVRQSVQDAIKDAKPAEPCKTCDHPFDHNVHHMQSAVGYHEFQPVKP